MYSKLIREMHFKTGLPMKRLQYEWYMAEKEINIEIMKDPYKYSKITNNLFSNDLKDNVDDMIYQIIYRKFLDNIQKTLKDQTDV